MLIDYESALRNKGIKFIAGIDEVGRGPLAGPMVVSAVVLDIDKIIRLNEQNESLANNDVLDYDLYKKYNSIKDSKLITEKKRVLLSDFITSEAISYSIREISNIELDSKGISQAFQEACFSLIKHLTKKPEHILIDAFEIKKITMQDQTNIIKGDNKSISIAAASIIGKVYRDKLMKAMHLQYPEYNFDSNKGYGTKEHIKAIEINGPCPIHRRSFEPIKSLVYNATTK